MRLFNLFRKKKPVKTELTEDDLSGDEICRIFYTLKEYQNNASNNYAVIKNREKFNWQIKIWYGKMNKIKVIQ